MLYIYLISYLSCQSTSLENEPHKEVTDTEDEMSNPIEIDVQDEYSEGCRAQPREENRERLLIYSTPYNEDISPSDQWSVRRISINGEISEQTQSLQLGRRISGEIYFTKDSSWAATVTENGHISTFLISADNEIKILLQDQDLGIYIQSIFIHSSGEYLYALDPNWPENGGGIYRINIDCQTGELDDPSLLYTSKNAVAIETFEEGLIIAARELENITGYVYYMDSNGNITGFDPFDGDEDVILTDLVVDTSNQIYLSENSEFSGVPNRVAIMNWNEGQFTLIEIQEILDPIQMLSSPFSSDVAVLSGYGNAIHYISNGEQYEVSHIGSSPQLPTSASQIPNGSLKGEIYITENQGIRKMKFLEGGGIEDLGLGVSTDGLSGITGSIGVTP